MDFTTIHAGNWHPLTWISHMIDCTLYGLNPSGHHWSNVEFYIENTVLLFLVLFMMTRAFSRELLERLPLEVNSDDFVFDNQMLSQILWLGYWVAEVSCPTKYFPEA